MENMNDSQEVSWRSQSFRQNVRAKIEEAIRQSGNPTQKSVPEMENHVFQKAKSREEYLGFVARLIIHVREMNSKKTMTGAVASQNMASVAGVGQPSDPMSALKSMAGQGTGTVTIQSQPGQTQMTASLLGSGGTISQMPTPPQPQPQIQVQSLGPGITPTTGPNVVTSSINPQGMSPMVMQPTRFLGPGNVLTSQPVQQRPMLAPQLIQKFRQQVQGPPPNVTSTQIQMQGNFNETMFMQSQQSPLSNQFQGHSPAPANIPNQGPNSNQPSVPSPAGHHAQNMGPQMAQSPAVYGQSPNPQIVQSPAANYNVRTPGAPSPGSALNTPISAGATASPINRASQEDCYLEKRKQLSKFIEPLKRMIGRIEKDENKKKDLSRMKSLYDILTDPNKRCSMEVLLKCEQVLEKMNPSFLQMDAIAPPTQPATIPMKSQEQNICQPFIDALTNISKSPMFNHILEKSFSPPITALFGTTVRIPSPPPKRRKIDDDSVEISDVLQGEIARLDQKFKVQIDPVLHLGARTVNLICQLDDKNLPCVPSISITVPDSYPENPPQCFTTKDEYESTSILQSIQQVLTTRLSTMPQKYSITSLLDTWEMSVRQACASKPVGVET